MSLIKTLRGADCILFINGQKYTQVVQIDYSESLGLNPIYGVDDSFPQELANSGRVSIRGKVTGLKLSYDGNLQGSGIRGLITSFLSNPYISIRVKDRRSQEDIIYIIKAKVSDEAWSIPAKKTVHVTFSFMGIRNLQPLDRVNPKSVPLYT